MNFLRDSKHLLKLLLLSYNGPTQENSPANWNPILFHSGDEIVLDAQKALTPG